MPTQVQFRRGTTAQNNAFTPNGTGGGCYLPIASRPPGGAGGNPGGGGPGGKGGISQHGPTFGPAGNGAGGSAGATGNGGGGGGGAACGTNFGYANGGGGGGSGFVGNSGNAGNPGAAGNPSSHNCVAVTAGCYPVTVPACGTVNISWNTQ